MPRKHRDEDLAYETLINNAMRAPMKPQKPDRFERIATRAAYELTWDKEHPDGGELQTAIVKELRKEHQWVERMIKAIYEIAEEMELSKRGFKDLMLEQLKQHRK